MRSLDPQVDNISRQSRGTVQQWKGTAHSHATGAFHKSFYVSNNVTTPFGTITVPNESVTPPLVKHFTVLELVMATPIKQRGTGYPALGCLEPNFGQCSQAKI